MYEVQSWFKNNTLHRIGVMTNGAKEYFWAANADISAKIQAGDLVAFETRGKVIVLAEPVSTPYISLALLNN
ncbi:MAG: hypothetical protein N2491_12685 [Negativicutes bacterium]|nr:hypothetical protein [Negativicutes bacterium]